MRSLRIVAALGTLALMSGLAIAAPAPKGPVGGYAPGVPLARYPNPYEGKKKILFVGDLRTGNQTAHDGVSHAMASMERAAREAGYVVFLRTDTEWVSKQDTWGKGDYAQGGPKAAKGHSLKDFDAVIFYTNGETEMTEAQRQDLLSYLKDDGKGLIGIHTAAATMYKWPAYGEMLGAYFDNHPWGVVPARVVVERPEFPGMAGLAADAMVTDEHYQFQAPFDRKNLDVIASIDPKSVDMGHPNVHRTDNDLAIVWAKNYGKGRVFYSALGHTDAMWDDPRILQMYVGAIKWVAGDAPYVVRPHAKP